MSDNPVVSAARLVAPTLDSSLVAERLAPFFAARREVVTLAYLFGSVAAQRAHRESDVDLALWLDPARLPTARERFELRLRLLHELALALGTDRVDLLILNDASPLVRRTVLHSGIRLFAASPRAALDFERDTQLLAADLAPFVERTRRLRLAALAR